MTTKRTLKMMAALFCGLYMVQSALASCYVWGYFQDINYNDEQGKVYWFQNGVEKDDVVCDGFYTNANVTAGTYDMKAVTNDSRTIWKYSLTFVDTYYYQEDFYFQPYQRSMSMMTGPTIEEAEQLQTVPEEVAEATKDMPKGDATK